MPSFSFLNPSKAKARARAKANANANNAKGDRQKAPSCPDSSHESSTDQKAQRRQSKRDYIRSFWRLSSLSQESRADRRASGRSTLRPRQTNPEPESEPEPEQSVSSPTKLPEPPVSPMDKDKPLPPPPPLGFSENMPPAKASVKLERIISPITRDELHQIFSGAPQFYARAEGHYTGAPHPSVCFPWDGDIKVRDLTDHWKIHDEAWGYVTAWPHITIQSSRNPFAMEEHHEKRKAHYLPRCRERPNMLSMHGIERGTMGYQAALEMGVADALEIRDGNLETSPEVVNEHRKYFLNGKDGLRPIPDSLLIDRLLDISRVYHEDPAKNSRPSFQLYSELFAAVLFPPSKITDHNDPYSLVIQVEALLEVLAVPMVWVDFSLVEWRIRLGQILWGVALDLDQEDGVSINSEMARDPGTERYWLLVQILLSCELLTRLDAISVKMDDGVKIASPMEIRDFEQMATTSIKWSLLLARTWLENITIERPAVTVADKKPGWRAAFSSAANPVPVLADRIEDIRFAGRHQSRQLSGLLHFARNIHWPDLDSLTAKAAANGITISDSIQSTPIETPLSVSTHRSSYFANRRPQVKRGNSLSRHVPTMIYPAGWLSNSYISGLILPGEGLSHFLISTLLENDPIALSRLGEQANLYGGFIYQGKSYWSTTSIVGRVLAAGKGATDCMGWVYSEVLPRGAKEGWMDIDLEETRELAILYSNEEQNNPRLWQKQAVEHDSHVVKGAEELSGVLPGDFVIPSDEPTDIDICVHLESLDMFEAKDSILSTPTEEEPTPFSRLSLAPSIKTYSAMMRFMVLGTEMTSRELNVALNHDVHFVTAHPCIPSSHVELLRSSLRLSVSSQSQPTELGDGAFNAHPLHTNYTFHKTSLCSLLSPLGAAQDLKTIDLIAAGFPTRSPDHTNMAVSSGTPQFLIIDCTDASLASLPPRSGSASPHSSMREREKKEKAKGGSDLEMLARAICAERGWDAVISRRGRGCLACAVREAGALAWRVVLRVA
ncbi:hypothetical protein LZ554_001177 [Drepanopeziza brunnea f. sp. 'monogermtubi']|nr:hypothetical protein LZ554_001177 [Drepanopeziza brunnea f. sp. 'monogermtubi']